MEYQETESKKMLSETEYKEYIALKVQLDILKRAYQKSGYCSLEMFNTVTGCNILDPHTMDEMDLESENTCHLQDVSSSLDFVINGLEEKNDTNRPRKMADCQEKRNRRK